MLKDLSQVRIKIITSQTVEDETECLENAYEGTCKSDGSVIIATYQEESSDGASDCELRIGRDDIAISSTGAVERRIELALSEKGLCVMSLQGMSLEFDAYMSEYELNVETDKTTVELKYDLRMNEQIVSENDLIIELIKL